jgi:putative endonuclease
MFHIYFAKSIKNGKVYVGYTSKTAQERVDEHNAGASTWSKSNGPFELIYYESYHCKADAVAKELFYKTGLGRQIKKAIIDSMGS